MSGNAKTASEKDRLVTRPDEPLPAVQNPQKHENAKDPKPAPRTESDTDAKARQIDYTV
jgi:hypothetical protein